MNRERLGRLLVPARWSVGPLRHAQIGGAVPAALVGLLVWPPVAGPAVLLAWAMPLRRLRRDARAAAQSVVRELPDVVDLFDLAFAAELNVRLAVEAVVRAGRGRIVDELSQARRRADEGHRLHVALAGVADRLGDPVRPLMRVLTDQTASPVDLRSQLAVVAVDARQHRRRLADIEARRVPVRLLFPLVVCVLPAFGLLTVVPIVVGSLGSVGA